MKKQTYYIPDELRFKAIHNEAEHYHAMNAVLTVAGVNLRKLLQLLPYARLRWLWFAPNLCTSCYESTMSLSFLLPCCVGRSAAEPGAAWQQEAYFAGHTYPNAPWGRR